MQTKQLEYFIAVAEELSFTRAAKRFFISQAALSMQVKSLEKELGTLLFDRDQHHVALTAAGTTFLDAARDIVQRTEDAVQQTRNASNASAGELRVGYVKGYERSGLSRMLANFHRHYPRAWVSLTRDGVVELYDALRTEKIDLVINILYPESDLGDAECQVLARYPLVAALPFDHPLAGRASIALDDLRGHPAVRYQVGSTGYGEDQRIERVASDYGLYDHVTSTYEDIETCILCILSGFGYALLPGFVTPTLSSDGRVVAVPIEGMEREITVVAAWLPTTRNDLIDVFLDEFLEVDPQA
jgi:DNA-binding transcriptional LysR family regulator